MSNEPTQPDKLALLELIEGFRRSKTMFVAVSLGLFDALLVGPKTATALARDLHTNEDALERLLDACVALRLLNRCEDGYVNTALSSEFLTKTSPNSLVEYVLFLDDRMWCLWSNLQDAVIEGTNRWKQTFGLDGTTFENVFPTGSATRRFVLAMHGSGLLSSKSVATAFDLSEFQRLVDLGGGTGHLAIAACKRNWRLTAVVFELPEVVPIAREVVAKTSMSSRINVVSGDFFHDPLPEGDLYVLGRVLQDWSKDGVQRLLDRVYQSLPVNGAILIAEKLLLSDKAGPIWAQLQNLGMLLCAEGRERTLAEYEHLLRRSGFVDVQAVITDSPLDAILATKRSRA